VVAAANEEALVGVMAHIAIILTAIGGALAICVGAVHLNVRYNKTKNYVPYGFLITRLGGALAGIVLCLFVVLVSRFW
jgi:hypothetical protein